MLGGQNAIFQFFGQILSDLMQEKLCEKGERKERKEDMAKPR